MTIRELVKNEIDMLPDDALYAVRDFVLSQKERLADDGTHTREKHVQWLKESWKMTDLENVTPPKNIPEMYFLPKPPNAPSFEELAGSWEDDRSAEEIIEDLRRSRTPNLDRVNFD